MVFHFSAKTRKKNKISLEGKNVRKSGSWIIYCYLQHTCLPYFWSKTLGGRAAVEDYSAVGVSKSLVEARAHCLGMNYYVNFLEGIDSNGFHIK